MSRIQTFKRVIVEDHPEKDRELVGKLASSINPFCEDVQTAFNNNLSIADNFNFTTKEINVTVDAAGIPITRTTIATNLNGLCRGIQVIRAQNLTRLQDTVGTIFSISISSLTEVVTTTPHGFSNGDYIIIMNSDSVPSIDGRWTVSVKNSTAFYLPMTVTGVGTVGTFIKSATPSSVPYIDYTEAGGIITINKITNLQANEKYRLRMILYP